MLTEAVRLVLNSLNSLKNAVLRINNSLFRQHYLLFNVHYIDYSENLSFGTDEMISTVTLSRAVEIPIGFESTTT